MFRLTTYRLLEMIPGFLIWLTLGLVVGLSLWQPLWAICFIIVFDLYWLIRVGYMLIYILTTWRHFRSYQQTNWYAKLTVEKKCWQEFYHLIFLPVAGEPLNLLRQSLSSIHQSQYPLKKVIFVLAGEDRDGNFEVTANQLDSEYGTKFFKFIKTRHILDRGTEIPGKGSNLNSAGRKVKKIIDELGLEASKIIVTTCDSDSRLHPQYLACLTYQFLSHQKPHQISWQPVAVYTNNAWQSHPVIRVIASCTTFWLFTDLARPERLFTFSSHSMSFQSLVKVGYWDKTIVTEDSRIFLQCLVHYSGNYSVEPIYLPMPMNTVDIGDWKKSFVNQYRQMRRWAWGAEHFPWMIKNFWGTDSGRRIPLKKKLSYLWNHAEGMYSWATAPMIILIVGHLPLWSRQAVSQTTLFFNTPFILETLMRLSMVGIIITAILYGLMLPPKPQHFSVWHYPIMILQWLCVPLTLILFGAVPATDAQTRLMLGGRFRLGFWITEKRAV